MDDTRPYFLPYFFTPFPLVLLYVTPFLFHIFVCLFLSFPFAFHLPVPYPSTFSVHIFSFMFINLFHSIFYCLDSLRSIS
jgi:hypothetical protein